MIEYRRNLALGNSYYLGKKHSEKSKVQMSESAKNKVLTKEHKNNFHTRWLSLSKPHHK